MTIHVHKFSGLNITGGARLPTLQAPALGRDVLTPTASSQQSAAFGDGVNFVRVHTDAACLVAIGADPDAVTEGWRMAANQTEIFGVANTHKLAYATV